MADESFYVRIFLPHLYKCAGYRAPDILYITQVSALQVLPIPFATDLFHAVSVLGDGICILVPAVP